MNAPPTLSTFARAYIMAALWTFDEDAPGGMDYRDTGRFEDLLPLMEADTLAKIQERDRLREALESLIDFVDCVGQERLIDSEVLKESYNDREEREDCLTEMFDKARAALNR